jgi:anti-sigma B factor antagonist
MSQLPRRRRIDIEDVGDVTVVTFLDKRLLDEQNIQLIGQQLFAVVDEQGRRRVLLDMGNVEYFSSAMLGKLLVTLKKLDAAGGRLAACGLASGITEVWEITPLHRLIRAFPTRDLAMRFLGRGAGEELLVACPVGCPGVARASAARTGGEAYLRCPACDARFQVVLPPVPVGGEAEAAVAALGDVTDGPPLTVKVSRPREG